MGRLFILGEEHVKADAHSSIHQMLQNNPNLLFLTEKREDVLELRRALTREERQREGSLLGQHQGNFALQDIFNNPSVYHENIHSIDADGTTSLFLAKKSDLQIQEFLTSGNPQATISALIPESDRYITLTRDNEGLIGQSNGARLIIRELRNKIMAQNIANFMEANPEKDIVVLCGAAHLCRTDMRLDQPTIPTAAEGTYRRSLLDYLSDKIGSEKIDGVYVEDNPQNFMYRQNLQQISRQIKRLYPEMSLNSFSENLTDLIEILKPTQQLDGVLTGAVVTPFLAPQQQIVQPESKAEEIRKKQEEQKFVGDSSRS